MKFPERLKNLIPLVPAGIIFFSMMFSHSCANTTQAPTGGPKDTIPPVLLAVRPLPGELNVPVHNTQIMFTFNEYVTVKELKNIYLSPPVEKPLKFKMRGKTVVVYTESDLEPNTTYTIDITGAIGDNNEGNMFPGYALTFSTGERIDSMYVTGVVQDCSTLKPIKNATVMLYKDQADSAIYLKRPVAAARTDDWGFFCIRNIQDTVYRLYAITDNNGNNMYDPENDLVAFNDSLVRPVNKVADEIYELYKFDMLDTASCLRRKTEYELRLFKGITSKQMIMNKERVDERTLYITFMSPDARIDTIKFKGISAKKIIKQFNDRKDSLIMWINDSRRMPDTLYMDIKYMKSDTTGALVNTTEKIKFPLPKQMIADRKSHKKINYKHEDTIAVYKVDVKPETFEQYGMEIMFDYPLVQEDFGNLKYEITNPKQKVEKGKFTFERDSTDIRRFRIRHSGTLLQGYEYKLTVPHRRFKDINGHYNDSTVTSVKLPDDDKLSAITLNMHNVNGFYIVDMMNEKRDNVLRSYNISSDTSLKFPYLKEGKYCIRIVEDKNGNNMVETGDLLTHRQPEKVRFFKLKDGEMMILVPPSSEMEQDIDLQEVFK